MVSQWMLVISCTALIDSRPHSSSRTQLAARFVIRVPGYLNGTSSVKRALHFVHRYRCVMKHSSCLQPTHIGMSRSVILPLL